MTKRRHQPRTRKPNPFSKDFRRAADILFAPDADGLPKKLADVYTSAAFKRAAGTQLQDAPLYEPRRWAGSADGNCYTYALDRAGARLDPGETGGVNPRDNPDYYLPDRLSHASGTAPDDGISTFQYDMGRKSYLRYMRRTIVKRFYNAAVADGLIPAQKRDIKKRKPGFYPVAMLAKFERPSLVKESKGRLTRDFDVHFLRRDADGSWSHRFIDSMPMKDDLTGRAIMNPETVKMGDYRHFAGYFWARKTP